MKAHVHTKHLIRVGLTLAASVVLLLPPAGRARPKRLSRGRTGTAAAEDSQPEILMGPFLRDLTLDGVTVVFRTTTECKAAVLYRNPGGEDVRLEDSEPKVHHEFRLHPLEPGKIYAYRPVVGGKEVPGGSFTTPPDPETPVLIGVYGDTRKYDEPHQMVVDGLARRSPDLVIHTGDLVHDGYKQSEWVKFFRIEGDLLRDTPLYPVIGNHDDRGKKGTWWFETLFGKGAQVRSIPYGPVQIVILNSEKGIRGQGKWLDEELARVRENPRIGYILAFIHHGPYGTGQFNGKKAVAKYIAPVLRKYAPAIIFSGHEHDYERGEVDGLPFYVIGGGGAVLGGRYCKGKCPSWSKVFKSVYHYAIVEASPSVVKVCVYYPNGLELEPCITYPQPIHATEAAKEEAEAERAAKKRKKSAAIEPTARPGDDADDGDEDDGDEDDGDEDDAE